MDIMSFITTNISWILLGVLLVTMIIVGYIADKTDFGHKKVNEKEKDKLESIKMDNISDVVEEAKNTEEVNTNEDLYSFDNFASLENNVDVSNNTTEDLTVPFGDTEVKEESNFDYNNWDNNLSTESAPLENETPENLSAPFGDVEVSNTDAEVKEENNFYNSEVNTQSEEVQESSNNDIFNMSGFENFNETNAAEEINEPVNNSFDNVSETNNFGNEPIEEIQNDSNNETIEEFTPAFNFENVDTVPETASEPIVEEVSEVSTPVENENITEVVEDNGIQELENIPEVEPVSFDEIIKEPEEVQDNKSTATVDNITANLSEELNKDEEYTENVVPEVIVDDVNQTETNNDIWNF